ncbi:FapA family protein [Tissierella sp.]|uniref:DUF342 domain-containing protein n=1 Tax=Tissierella sp. TaxID=41274 RepID=UPI00286588C3|nr:FapA family protein [Tissierella sp.]MDR7856242.1 FapA family protein [Tissierella sp.]
MYKISNDIILEISKDGLYAYITLLDNYSYNNESGTTSIINEIKNFIKYGLDTERLIRILEKKQTGEKICIAEGKKPEAGKDGDIKYFFAMEKPLLPKINMDGTVDYKELDSINSVKKDDKLAEIIPATDGVNGMMVNGTMIPSLKGRTPKFRYGKNVYLSSDGMLLISEIDGLVEFKNGKVDVSTVLSLDNVDNSVGNINFAGNVIVKKDVLNGFSLIAGGSVEVKGAVEGGYIESDGDILIRQGIQGYNRLIINTKGNLSAKFIENSVVNVGENVTAEAVMHSNVSSKSNILVLGKKGLIVGGTCRAKYEIRARVIGSTMATTTVLEVGNDPDSITKNEELGGKLELANENLRKVNQSLKVLEMLKRSNKLDNNKAELYNNLTRAQATLSQEIIEIENELVELNKQMKDISKGQIKVSDTIYPGVKIIIGNSLLYIRDEMKRCTFYRDGADIRVGPY